MEATQSQSRRDDPKDSKAKLRDFIQSIQSNESSRYRYTSEQVTLCPSYLDQEDLERLGKVLASGKCPPGVTVLHQSINQREDLSPEKENEFVNCIANALASGKCPPGTKVSFSTLTENSANFISQALLSGQCPENLSITLWDTSKDVIEIITHALTSKQCPQGLKIKTCNISDECITYFANALTSGHCPKALSLELDSLSIKGNESIISTLSSGHCPEGLSIKFPGYKVRGQLIAEVLTSGNCPRGLQLDFNYFATSEAAKICAGIMSGKSPEGLKMKFGSNYLNDDAFKPFTELFSSKQCPKGLTLDLSSCGNGNLNSILLDIAQELEKTSCAEGLTFIYPQYLFQQVSQQANQAFFTALLKNSTIAIQNMAREANFFIEYQCNTIDAELISDEGNKNIQSLLESLSKNCAQLPKQCADFWSPRADMLMFRVLSLFTDCLLRDMSDINTAQAAKAKNHNISRLLLPLLEQWCVSHKARYQNKTVESSTKLADVFYSTCMGYNSDWLNSREHPALFSSNEHERKAAQRVKAMQVKLLAIAASLDPIYQIQADGALVELADSLQGEQLRGTPAERVVRLENHPYKDVALALTNEIWKNKSTELPSMMASHTSIFENPLSPKKPTTSEIGNKHPPLPETKINNLK